MLPIRKAQDIWQARRSGAALPRPVLFAAVGLVNTAVDLAAYWALTRPLDLEPLLANALAYGLGALHGYIANGKLTFRSMGVKLLALKPFAAFAATSAISLTASTATMAVLLELVPDLLAKLITVGVTFVINYALGRSLVYRAARVGRVSPD